MPTSPPPTGMLSPELRLGVSHCSSYGARRSWARAVDTAAHRTTIESVEASRFIDTPGSTDCPRQAIAGPLQGNMRRGGANRTDPSEDAGRVSRRPRRGDPSVESPHDETVAG